MRCILSSSLLATVYWSRDEDGIGWSKLLLESALECPYVYSALPLLRDRLHLVRDTAEKNSLTLQYRWHQSPLVQTSKKIEMDEKTNL